MTIITLKNDSEATHEENAGSCGCAAAFRRICCAMKIDGEPDVRKAGSCTRKYGRDLGLETEVCRKEVCGKFFSVMKWRHAETEVCGKVLFQKVEKAET